MNGRQRDERRAAMRTAVDRVMEKDLAESGARASARALFLAETHRRTGQPKPMASRLRSARGTALAVGLVLAAALWVFFVRDTRDGALAFHVGDSMELGRVGARIAADEGRTAVRFSDGTLVTLAPSAAARVVEVSGHGAALLVERGEATVSVVHKDALTRWSIAAGPFDVEVTGTLFDVAWEPSLRFFRLRLDEGSVVIQGCGLPRTAVRAGETFSHRCDAGREADLLDASRVVEVATDAGPEDIDHVRELDAQAVKDAAAKRVPLVEAPKGVGHGVEEAAPATLAGSVDAGSDRSWFAHYRAGDYAAAFNDALPSFDEICERSTLDDVRALADAARLSRQNEHARRALTRLRARFPGTRDATMSAFYLGVIAFDQGAFPQAAAFFESCLREDHGLLLSREAGGRLIEASERAGDATRARAAAESYVRAFPDGPHASRAQRILKASP